MPSGKELIQLNSVAHLINQLAGAAIAGQPNSAGSAAAQQVAAAEEGIQGGLAQGKQKAMEEEAKKAKKKGLLKKVVSTVVGTAASAIPVAGPIVGPMIGEAAGSLASGQPIDPLEVGLAGVGGIPGTIDQHAARNPDTPGGTATAENSTYDPTTGKFNPNQTPQQAPASQASPPQQPVAVPTAPPAAAQQPQPQPVPASSSSAPAPAPAAAPNGQAEAVQAASDAITLPPPPPQTPVSAPPAPPALPQAAPKAAPPANVNPQGLGQRIASALTSEAGQSVTGAIKEYLQASQAGTEQPSVYAPGLNPQTSLAIDQQFAARADAEAQRAIQEEQLGLQREGLGIDKSKLQLEKERLAQEGAAQQAQMVLEQGKLGLSTWEAGANAAARKDTYNLSVYGEQAQTARTSGQLRSSEKIAAEGNATQIKASQISAGATLAAAAANRAAAATEGKAQREFEANMRGAQSVKTEVTPTGEIIASGTRFDATGKGVQFVEKMPIDPEIQKTLAIMQQDEKISKQVPQLMAQAIEASTNKMTGTVDWVAFNNAIPKLAASYGALTGTSSPKTKPADKPQAGPSQADKTTQENDAKLKALKTGQAAQVPTAAQPTTAPTQATSISDVNKFLIDPAMSLLKKGVNEVRDRNVVTALINAYRNK